MTSKKAIKLIERYGYYQFILGGIFHKAADENDMVISFRALSNYIGGLESRIERMEDAQRWISVKVMTPDSSRLPERYDVVITSRPHVETAYYKNHKWFVYEGGNKVDITNLVTHWKERPLPPEDFDNEPA